MKQLRLLAPAETEMVEAASFYESQAPRLGVDFLKEVESAARDIQQDPERWPELRSQIRRRLVHRFPYGVLYRVNADEIVIVAVMHLHRHPHYWDERI